MISYSVDAAQLLQNRGDAGRQRRADGVERFVDAAGQGAHACGRTEGDKSDDERVFHQILTFFTVGQILELDEELDKQVIHLKSLHSAVFPASARHIF